MFSSPLPQVVDSRLECIGFSASLSLFSDLQDCHLAFCSCVLLSFTKQMFMLPDANFGCQVLDCFESVKPSRPICYAGLLALCTVLPTLSWTTFGHPSHNEKQCLVSCTVLLGKLDFLLTCKIHFLEYSTGLFPLLLKIEVCWEWEGFMWGCPSSLLSLLVFNYLNVASYYPVIMLKEEVWVIKKQTYILSYVIAALVHCCS